MSLKDLAQQLEGVELRANGIADVEDSFDSPIMIMNQIHEA